MNPKKKTKASTWILILLIMIGGKALSMKPSEFETIYHYFALKTYTADIEQCAAKMDEDVSGIIIGSEYDCAINIAATFYNEDPEKAIALCSKYSLTFAPKTEYTDNICKMQIEEIIKGET